METAPTLPIRSCTFSFVRHSHFQRPLYHYCLTAREKCVCFALKFPCGQQRRTRRKTPQKRLLGRLSLDRKRILRTCIRLFKRSKISLPMITLCSCFDCLVNQCYGNKNLNISEQASHHSRNNFCKTSM